jgi:hypothetical protein
MNEMMDENSDESLRERHLDWTAKQGRILTANGRANEYFCQERGFPFEEDELPHYYLMRGDCDTSFPHLISQPPICGAWSRAYFVGGWEYSSDQEETVYNVQTNTLFIDLRVPTTRKRLLPSTATSLSDYTVEHLKYYARQHVFCGFSVVSTEKQIERLVCVRHHCLDWNFVGTPRSRPNKWWIEMNDDSNKWKEWAFATDDHGQHYYCEQWERLPGGESSEPVLALRKQRLDDNNDDEDGMLLVVGTHFNYIKGHAVLASGCCHKYPNATSLVTLVDAALEAGDLATALEWLGRIEAGHGHVDNWIVDCAIQPWKENTRLFQKEELVVTGGNDFDETCHVLWKGERWNVFETTFQNVQQLKDLFQ